MAKKKKTYKNIVPKDTRVKIKDLNIEIRGGFFYTQKELKRVHDAGFTQFVGIEEPKKKEEPKE